MSTKKKVLIAIFAVIIVFLGVRLYENIAFFFFIDKLSPEKVASMSNSYNLPREDIYKQISEDKEKIQQYVDWLEKYKQKNGRYPKDVEQKISIENFPFTTEDFKEYHYLGGKSFSLTLYPYETKDRPVERYVCGPGYGKFENEKNKDETEIKIDGFAWDEFYFNIDNNCYAVYFKTYF